MVHRNAPLSETGRLRLARCVVEDGWPLRRAAERFQVSHSTAARWAGRYRQHGAAGMGDRPSRPHASPARTAVRTERRIIKLRVSQRLGPARIAFRLGLNPSTVHRVLARYGCPPLAHLDRATGRVVRRYERAAPGELVHVDIKKLGNIPDGGGWRADVERLPMPGAAQYARFCGATLARAHARWGDRIAIASYLGQGDMFDRAIAEFAAAYADQNERDYAAFAEAVNSGRLIAQTGV